MGSSQSCGPCDLEKNTSTKSGSYVEQLLQIKHTNFLNSHSIEPKEVLQSRKERILKALTDRKPAKPYVIQLLEARAAAKSELSIPDNLQEPNVDDVAGSNDLQAQNVTKEPDQKLRILQRIAARRKSKRPINTSMPTTVNIATSPAVNSLSSSVVNTSTMRTTSSTAVNISPSPSVHILTPPAFDKATQSDPPISVLSTASQSSSLGSSIDSAIQVAPAVQSSLQQTVRLSEPKIYVHPPTPSPKILTPPPPRLLNQPPLSARQSISAAFSRPSPPSAVESGMAPSPPSFSDLLENVGKDKLNQYDSTRATECPLCVEPPFLSEIKVCNSTDKHKTNYHHKNYNKLSNWKPVSMEEKKIYCNMDPVPLMSSPLKSVPCKKLLTLDEEQPLDFDSDDSYRKRHTAAVDKLTNSLIANWAKKKTSAELLGADEKELSLLTYSESKRSVVPHFPVRREMSRSSQGYTNPGGALVIKDSLPSVRFGKTRHSQLYCESRREKRCMRHRDN